VSPYPPGTEVILFCDQFPSTVTPRPDGVPSGVKLRTLVTKTADTPGYLTIGWQTGSLINRVDIELSEGDTDGVTYRGGQVGGYTVEQANVCRCGAKKVTAWKPFPGVTYQQQARMERVAAMRAARTPGLPSPRYSRT
jgi:hypothetical protein